MLSGDPSGDIKAKLTRPPRDGNSLIIRLGNLDAVAGLNGYPYFSDQSKFFCDKRFSFIIADAPIDIPGSPTLEGWLLRHRDLADLANDFGCEG